MNLWGPLWARLIFHGFVVLVGILILSGAQNTSIVGANGVLNRVAEDGVLTDAFQKPHPRYGTSYRIINLIVALQLFTIVLTRGNVFTLAGLYAFGVVWSFAMMALAVLVLRYTETSKREWRVPLNIPLGKGRELPLGVILIATVLFITALVNFFTKYTATIGGVTFSLVFFAIFTYSERRVARERAGSPKAWTSSACTAASNRRRKPWASAPEISWLPFGIRKICTTCAKSCAVPTPNSRTLS